MPLSFQLLIDFIIALKILWKKFSATHKFNGTHSIHNRQNTHGTSKLVTLKFINKKDFEEGKAYL